jgi:hypothetical protein
VAIDAAFRLSGESGSPLHVKVRLGMILANVTISKEKT